MKKVVLAVLTLALLATAVPAQGRDSGRRYYIAMNKSDHLRVSFYVRDGKVRRAILDVRQVLCSYPSGKARISTYLDRAKIENHAFKTRYQEQFDNFVLKGTVSRRSAAGTASVKQLNNGTKCRSGKIDWAAERVRFREWKDFRDIYD